jgi:hypothetical protein
MSTKSALYAILATFALGIGAGISQPAQAVNECLQTCRQDYQECIHTCTYPYQCNQCSVIYQACASLCV